MADHYRQQSDYDYNDQQSNYRAQHSNYGDQQSDYDYNGQQNDNRGQQYNYNTQQTAYSRQSSNYSGQQQNNSNQKSNNRAFIIGIIAILVIGAVGIIIAVSVFGFDDNSSNSSIYSHKVTTVLTDMYDQYCSRTGTWCSVGDDGSYLRIDTNPSNKDSYTNENALTAIKNINSALGLPDSLLIEMESTVALDGTRSETFDSIGITVSWSYAPSKGLEVTYRFTYK